jgi:hypothetical protein
MLLSDIQIRDPFLVADPATGLHYLFGSTDRDIWSGPGTGFDAYRSADLATWEGPFEAFRAAPGFWGTTQFWAPEVHRFAGRWFMFATFADADGRRGTQILVADLLPGPFLPWSDGPVTPRGWQCLDGTLYVDRDGDPWIVFCHEWTQLGDGAVVAQRLSADLARAVGKPITLFHATAAPWTRAMPGAKTGSGSPAYVTDGPFLFRLDDGTLAMLWSGFGEHGYALGVAVSAGGDIAGPWSQRAEPLWSEDGGHGMVLRLADGGLALTLHQPNTTPDERAVIHRLIQRDGTVAVGAHV